MRKHLDVQVVNDASGHCKQVHVNFGPHHFLEITQDGDRVTFRVGATHHGFEADASSVPSELERFVEEIRAAHPENRID